MSENPPLHLSGNQGLNQKRIKLYSIVMPICLILLFVMLYLVYVFSIKWASTTDQTLKMLFGIGGITFSILGVFFGINLVVFISWVIRGNVPPINLSSIASYLLVLLPDVPFRRRLIYIVFGIPLILIDIGVITVVAGIVIVGFYMGKEVISSIPNLLVGGVETIVIGVFSLYWLYLHISFIHWIVTGRIINTIEQGRDWSFKP